MDTPQDKTPEAPVPAAEPAPEKELPLDTRILSDAVIELNISRKNVSIYPPGHAQITKSIDRAYDVMLKLFAIREEMTLGVAKDTLFVGQNYLDQRNPVYRDFALSLNAQGVAAVTFRKGLDLGELERFHRIITTRPEDILAAGGIATVAETMDIPHIRITAIDYESFHLTEEQEIFKAEERPGDRKSAEKTGGSRGSGMWMEFVSLLSSGTLAKGGEGVALRDAEQIDPAELAKLLNERKLDASAAADTYDHIISSHVRRKAETRLTREQSETLSNLNAMLRDLHPDLRKQFLSSAFKNLSAADAGGAAEEVLGGMNDDMIIEMLRQASTEGREISPTLTGLLSKMASVRDRSKRTARATEPQQAVQRPRETTPEAGGPEVISGQMENLFQREKYEQYVETDYDQMLKDITDRAATMAAVEKDAFPVGDFLATLEDEHLDFQTGRALIAFMEEDIDEEDYREFAKKLSVTVPELLTTGNFVLLLDILQTLRWHLTDKKNEAVRKSAADVLTVFWQPDFVAKAVTDFDTWSRTRAKAAADFLKALGPVTVPGLLDLFAQDSAPGGRRVVFELLAGFGAPAVNEALKRLQDPRPFFVRNLLLLIRRAATGPDVVAEVKPLLQHKDPKVKMEALAVLLRFKDPSAVERLRQEIMSPDPDVSSQAVFTAGQFRIAEAVDRMLSLIKSVVFFESDYRVNEEIIKALGEIGDARALPELEKLARSGLSIHRASHDRMKLTLFESLERYPRESIADLLAIGEKSGDERIRKACRKLAERH